MYMVTRVGTALLVAIALLSTSWLVAGVRAQDEEPENPFGEVSANVNVDFERTITVTGEGRVFVQPDVGQVTLGVQIEDDDLSQALEQANQQMSAIIDALTQLGIPEDQIQTTTFNIDVARDREQEAQPITGYTVTNLVQVTVPELERIGEVIDAAIEAGANRVTNVQFTVQDPEQALRQAREEALQDARSTAQHLADLAGVGLGQPVSISESFAPPPRPLAVEEAAITEQAPPIAPGQQEIVVTVSVSYAMEPEPAGE